MREEVTDLQQPMKYWFGETYPLSSAGVMHHIACVDELVGSLEGREEEMRRAGGGVAGAIPSRPTFGLDARVRVGGDPENRFRCRSAQVRVSSTGRGAGCHSTCSPRWLVSDEHD